MITLVPRIATLVALLLVPFATMAQGPVNYAAEIQKTSALLKDNPNSEVNRVRLATLQYLRGAEQLKGGNAAASIETFRAGLATLQQEGHIIARTNTAYQALWYGLGYSLRATGQFASAIASLDPLAANFPKLLKGRYLLGITLVESGTAANVSRGIDVLAQIANSDTGGDGQAARRTAMRLAYNYGTVLASEGKSADAAKLMLKLNKSGRVEGATSGTEQQDFLYGAGFFKQQAGLHGDAIADYEALKLTNSDFKLRNGISLPLILSNAYYDGGLADVAGFNQDALKQSVDYFEKAEKTGNPKAADVNYGKALAYLKMGVGQDQNVAKELELVAQKDPDLYRRVNRAQ